MSATDRLKLGALVGAHGVGGGLRVRLYDEHTQALVVGRKIVLEASNGQTMSATILRVAKSAGDPMAKVWVQEITDRNSADTWQGASVCMARDQLPALQDGEFYLADTLDKTALLVANGAELGVVSGVTSNGAQDLLVIQWCDEAGAVHEWMLPAMRPFLRELTPQGLWVAVPEGFLPDALEARLGRDGALVADQTDVEKRLPDSSAQSKRQS